MIEDRPTVLQLAAALEREGIGDSEAIRIAQDALFKLIMQFYKGNHPWWKLPEKTIPKNELLKRAKEIEESLERYIVYKRRLIDAIKSVAEKM